MSAWLKGDMVKKVSLSMAGKGRGQEGCVVKKVRFSIKDLIPLDSRLLSNVVPATRWRAKVINAEQ
jgi:hypothetical protein